MGGLEVKRVNNLYNQLFDINFILNTYNIIKKNTKNKNKLEKFEENLSINLIDIKDKIGKNIDKYNLFMIYEPKERLILSLNLKDKIINHMVGYILFDVLEKSLIDSNVAVRVNKGTSYGIKLVKKYIKNLNYNYYCLKIDIKKYFYSINRCYSIWAKL